MEYPLLERVTSPEDVKALTAPQLEELCAQIRAFLIESVSRTGGHLSSNLGTIELTVAMHRAFTTPQDKILFDVGHQCYTHKILTGRRDRFDTLRKFGGLSGFPSPKESEHDAFVAGHGNTAISTAIGMARAKKLKGEPGKVIAVVGDGAFTGGMVYEGMNNIDTLNNLIVVLNDNKMSISKNVGTMARYLTALRTDPRYFKAKAGVETFLDSVPLVGAPIKRGVQGSKQMLRRFIYNSTMFEEMGFQYVGPLDGHDVQGLAATFSNLQHQTAPLFIHVVTVKGKGFKPAEENPGEFHGVSAFDPLQVLDPDVSPAASFSTEFGKELARLGGEREDLCAITAAMKYGTGLQFFYREFPKRFFDVGMAEQHAVTFAAGLASQGMLPVVGIYSTFLQRSYDQLIHDVKLMELPVILAVDRAGLVPGDGETHQGIHDVAFLSEIGIPVVCPCNYEELRYWLDKLVKEFKGPRSIRYARGEEPQALAELGCSGRDYDRLVTCEGAKAALVSYGTLTEEVLTAAKLLQAEGNPVQVYKMTKLHPLPEGLCEELSQHRVILFAEDTMERGGVGAYLAEELLKMKWQGEYLHMAIKRNSLPHGLVAQLRQATGLNGENLAKVVKECL